MENIRENKTLIKCLIGTFFIDRHTILDMVNRCGKYHTLTNSEVDEQINIIEVFFKEAFPRVHGYILDYKENNLSTAFVIEQKFGAQFAYGGYLEWESEILGKIIHDKAVASTNNAESVSSFLKSFR